MIKKILGLFIIGFGILNFGFGYTLIENCYTGASSTCNTFDNSWPCLEIENNEEFVIGNYTYKVDNNANFNSSFQGGDYYKSYIFKKTSNSNNYFSYFFRGEDNKLHKVYTRTYRGSSVTFDSGGVCIVNSSNINEIASICGFKVNNPGNVDGCISGIPNVYKGDINEFYNTNGGFDKIYFLPGTDNQGGQYFNGGRFCFTKGNTGYCLYSQFDDLFGKYSDIGTPVIDSTDLSNSKFNIDNNSSDFYESPFNGSSSGGFEGSNNDILITSSCSKQKALNYYENKGYTDKLCYGGYDDFIIWDGSPTGVLPYYGSGLDIEEIWLETANYYQGGLTGDSQSYKAWFGYRRQMYTTYKRGGYSSNPFVNTPLVMFGLFGAVDTYGSSYNSNEILEYCDLKLYTADYTVDYTGINYNNVCVSPISFLDDQINDIISGSGYNGTGFIGIDTNEILSGAGISLSGDLLIGSNTGYVEGSNFILDFSQKLKNNFGDIANNNYGQGILPIYITLALLGLILFRFMSH